MIFIAKPAIRCLLLAPLLCGGLLLTACDKAAGVYIAGSTTVLPIASKAAKLLKTQLDTPFIINAGGSGVGVNQLGRGNIDIGMISRELTAAEIKQYPPVQFVTHTIGKDAVVPVVSSEIYAAGVRALSLQQIGNIYRGEISNWRQLGGPDREILVVDKEKSRGTRHVFMQVVLGDKYADAAGADLVLGDNNEEQTAIAQSDAAIGMLSNAWLNDDVKGLAIVLPDQSAITPTLENIANGKFPITRNLLLLTNGEAKGPSKSFIDFLLSDRGQQLVRDSGYVSIH